MKIFNEIYEQLVSWGEYVLWGLFSVTGFLFSVLFLVVYVLSFLSAIALPVALMILVVLAIASLL